MTTTDPGDLEPSGLSDSTERDDELAGDRQPTPIFMPRRWGFIGGAGLIVFVLFLLWLVPSVLTIAIGGSAFALLLSYPVRILARYMPRTIAVVVTLLGLVVIVAGSLYLAIPPLAEQVTNLVEDAPELVTDAEDRLRETMQRLEEEGRLPADADELIGDMETELGNRAKQAIEPVLTGLLGQLTGIVGLFITLFGILFVGISLLVEGDRLRRRVTASFPDRYHDDLDQLWHDLGTSMSRYLGGLIVVAIAQGVMVSIGLLFLDIPYALLLGLWVAMTAVVPYVGAWLGAIPAVILAALGNPIDIIWVGLLYLGVNIIEGNVLTPRIQGDAVRVHPILVLLTIVAVGSLFGLLGVILAVPMLAIGRVFFDFFRVRLHLLPDHPRDAEPGQQIREAE